MNKEHFEETLKAIQADHARELSEAAEKMAEERHVQDTQQRKKAEEQVEGLKREIKGLLSQLEVSVAGDFHSIFSARESARSRRSSVSGGILSQPLKLAIQDGLGSGSRAACDEECPIVVVRLICHLFCNTSAHLVPSSSPALHLSDLLVTLYPASSH